MVMVAILPAVEMVATSVIQNVMVVFKPQAGVGRQIQNVVQGWGSESCGCGGRTA